MLRPRRDVFRFRRENLSFRRGILLPSRYQGFPLVDRRFLGFSPLSEVEYQIFAFPIVPRVRRRKIALRLEHSIRSSSGKVRIETMIRGIRPGRKSIDRKRKLRRRIRRSRRRMKMKARAIAFFGKGRRFEIFLLFVRHFFPLL